jgi:hypothetical protein
VRFCHNGCDGSLLLEPSEETLDEMSGLIKVPVELVGGSGWLLAV